MRSNLHILIRLHCLDRDNQYMRRASLAAVVVQLCSINVVRLLPRPLAAASQILARRSVINAGLQGRSTAFASEYF